MEVVPSHEGRYMVLVDRHVQDPHCQMSPFPPTLETLRCSIQGSQVGVPQIDGLDDVEEEDMELLLPVENTALEVPMPNNLPQLYDRRAKSADGP